MFLGIPDNALEEFKGDINKGDLIELKEGMMLIEPIEPVIVLSADNKKGIYDVMYLRNNYTITCSRIDIKGLVNEAR